jgi:XTP/dITP diphosphohydrolase
VKLVFATTNKGKVAELEALVRGLPIEICSLRDFEPVEVIEDGETFEANALKKALAYRQLTGLPSLADDTGLCVEALGGAPGVRSARYAGIEDWAGDPAARYRANNIKLLAELAGVPMERRGAAFRCALCLALPGQEPLVVHGECSGRIGLAERGGHGFGFDPLFELPEHGKTLAEITSEEKNRISHRARAFQALWPHLERLAAGGKLR